MLFKGKYAFLSNMSLFPYPIEIDGLMWNNSECYYQAQKTTDKELIRSASEMNPYECKKVSKSWELRKEYNNEFRLKVMRKIIDIKFNIPYFRDQLLKVDVPIIEENSWGDTFFGMCNGKGSNHLGKIIEDKKRELEETYSSRKPNIIIGDLYETEEIKKYDYIGFTANSFINSMGSLVMGAGNAKVIRDKFTKSSQYFGKNIEHLSEYGIKVDEDSKLIAVQTKKHFKDDSELPLVIRTLKSLAFFAEQIPNKKIGIPFPAINHGGLKVSTILPYLSILPSNVYVYSLPTFHYTGIGSRDIPDKIKTMMSDIARCLERKGYILRSGGADGSDLAFENGVTNDDRKEIYLPWKGFNSNTSKLHEVSFEAIELSSQHHLAFPFLKPPVKKLMGRNTYQVLGKDLNKISEFVICYTKDGCKSSSTRSKDTGGTGLAISLADSLGVPIYNLADKEDFKFWKQLLINEALGDYQSQDHRLDKSRDYINKGQINYRKKIT